MGGTASFQFQCVVTLRQQHRYRRGASPAPPIPPVVSATPALQVIPVESDLSEFKKEIDILSKCASPYIVSYIGSYVKDGDLWIVMEYCGAGEAMVQQMGCCT